MRLLKYIFYPLRPRRMLSYARHYRGYGVHSPFAYSLKRDVFMRHGFLGSDRSLFLCLRGAGVGSRRSEQLQNMYTYLSYNAFAVDPQVPVCPQENTLYVFTERSDIRSLERFSSSVGQVRLTLCVMYPMRSRRRAKLCTRIQNEHDGMSIDNLGFVLFFYNDSKRKQHINL